VYSNCWIYAFWKRIKEGGWLMARKSRFGWWPHYAHMDEKGIITEFAPLAKKKKRITPPVIFKGEIRRMKR
jgi:hypothetical protein